MVYLESAEDAKRTVFTEIAGAETDVRDAYLGRYGQEAERFAELMAQTIMDWQAMDQQWKGDEKRGRVANLLFCAISLHMQSMKLFLGGHLVAAGNLSRQVLEALAMALLGSGKTLTNMDRFVAGKYGANCAVRDVWRNRKTLGLRDEGVNGLVDAEKFYHDFSHISFATIATMMRFKEQEGLFLGASFDEGKLAGYDVEVGSRMRVAELFPNYIAAIAHNLAKW